MEEEIKRWTVRRYSVLVLEIIEGKASVAAARRQLDLTRTEIESGVEDSRSSMETPLRAKSEDASEQYGRLLKGLQEAHSETTLEFAPQKKSWHPCW